MITEMNGLSAREIKLYQDKKLAQMLDYLQHNSPFYKEYFQRHGIRVKHVNSIEQLCQVPAIGKSDFSERNFDFLCVGRDRIIDYSTTSGTTGKAVTIALTENDLQRLAINEAQSFSCAKGLATDLYQLMLTTDRQFMAGLAYSLGIRKMGAGMVRVGPASSKIQWQNILEYKPTALVVVPSFILKLIDFAEAEEIDLNSSGIKKAICIGEPINNGDLSANLLAKRINEKWDIELFSTYASTEMQTAFTECEYHCGGHFQDDLIITEILDDAGVNLGPGEFGEVTITTLGVEGMPLLRYRTGDICCFYDEPCKCGRNGYRLSPVVGRKSQMIKYKGTTLFPTAIFNSLSEVKEVEDYVVEVTKNEFGSDEIIIHIYQTGNLEKIVPEIELSLKAAIKVIPTLNFVSKEQIVILKQTENRKPVSVIFR